MSRSLAHYFQID